MSKLQKHLPSLFSIFLGLTISWIFSHPSSPAKRRIPAKSAKSVHFFPNLKIHRKTHYYHFHHWMYFGIVYLILFVVRKRFKGKKIVEGFFLGLVLQGLSYRDRFKIKFASGLAY